MGFLQLKYFQTLKTWIKPFKIECLIYLELKSPKIISFRPKIKHNMFKLNSTWKFFSQARLSFPFCHKFINSQPTTQFIIINIILYFKPSRNIYLYKSNGFKKKNSTFGVLTFPFLNLWNFSSKHFSKLLSYLNTV